MPVAFNFFNPTTDLPTAGTSNGVESFSDLLRNSSASRMDQSPVYQRDSRAEVQPRQHRLPHFTARYPLLQPPATGTTPPSHIIGTHPREIQRPPTTHMIPSTVGIGAPLAANQLRRQASLPQMSTYHPSRLPSHSFNEEYSHRAGMF